MITRHTIMSDIPAVITPLVYISPNECLEYADFVVQYLVDKMRCLSMCDDYKRCGVVAEILYESCRVWYKSWGENKKIIRKLEDTEVDCDIMEKIVEASMDRFVQVIHCAIVGSHEYEINRESWYDSDDSDDSDEEEKGDPVMEYVRSFFSQYNQPVRD